MSDLAADLDFLARDICNQLRLRKLSSDTEFCIAMVRVVDPQGGIFVWKIR